MSECQNFTYSETFVSPGTKLEYLFHLFRMSGNFGLSRVTSQDRQGLSHVVDCVNREETRETHYLDMHLNI